MPRIAIDARITHYTQAGIAQYTQHLIRELAIVDSSNAYLILHSRKDARNLANAPRQRKVKCWTPSHHRYEHWALAAELMPRRIDLLHSPDFIPPQNGWYRSVVTVHDLAFLKWPAFMTPQSRRYYNQQIEAATRRADHIIAVSEATKADLIRMLAVPEEKVSVVYEAADEGFGTLPGPVVKKHLANHSLSPGYILFLGTFEPRKNLDGLLRAYAIVRSSLPDVPPLVMAGRRGWLVDDLEALITSLGLSKHVQILGEFDQTDLHPLYAGAAVLCMPSHYEGFGLPALEAMACGTPVVVSDRSSLPEVVGEAGLLVDPDRPEDIADALRRVLTDSTLAAELAVAGPARAANFSWRETARQTLDVYERVLG